MNPDVHADYRRQAAQHFGASAGDAASARPQPTRPATGAYEHQNIALLPDEEVRFAADFTPSPLLRHIKTGLAVTNDRVIVRHPQYMFFIIRVGHAESSVPIPQICNVTTGRQLSQRRIIYAAIAGFTGLFTLMSLPMAGGFMGAIGLLIALVLFGFTGFQVWMARSLALIVAHGGGDAIRVDVDKNEHQAMLEADSVIQRLIVDSHRSTTARPVSDSATEALGSAPAPAQPATPTPPVRPTTPAAPPPTTPTARPSAPPSIWRG